MQAPLIHRALCLLAAALLASMCIGCAPTAPTEPPAEVKQEPVSAPPGPKPESPEAKLQSQKLAQDALDLLQKGEESTAQEGLERALWLDPNNELARKLIAQIRTDANKELGATSFAYTVQPDDTLSKLAQRFLNDRYRFYILAKYNDMRVPNKLATGQTIRIPGTEPKTAAVSKSPMRTIEQPGKYVESPKAIEPPKSVKEHEPSSPSQPSVAAESESSKQQATIQRYLREAEIAYRRQDLNTAIQKWDQVLRLSPNNQQAKLKRENAIRLKENIEKIK